MWKTWSPHFPQKQNKISSNWVSDVTIMYSSNVPVIALIEKVIGNYYVLHVSMDRNPLCVFILKQSRWHLIDNLLKKKMWGLHFKVSLAYLVLFQKLPSALMLAADNDAAECVKLLLEHNAKVKDVDHKGYNALCRAILVGKKYILLIMCVV